MSPHVDWPRLIVTDTEFAALRTEVETTPRAYRINWLDHQTLDRLYAMVFPDGSLTVPSGGEFRSYGPILDIDDVDELLDRSDFDAPKHQRHAEGWTRSS